MAPQRHYYPIVGGVGGNVGNWQFGDTTLTKIFVGGLAWETRTDALRRHFEQFGEILEAVVITDKFSGRSKGYGFVTFKDAESAARACVDPAPMIDGRRANCNLAYLGAAGIRAQPGNPTTQQGFGRVIRPIIGSGPHSGFNPSSSAATGLYYSPAPHAYHHPFIGYAAGTYPQENLYNPLNYYGNNGAGGQQPQLHFSNPYTTTTSTGSSAFIHYPYYTQYAPSGGTSAFGVQYHPVLQQYQYLQQRQLQLQQYSTGFISSPPASVAGPATTTTTAGPSSPPVTTAAEQ